jgi:hypothetical protein
MDYFTYISRSLCVPIDVNFTVDSQARSTAIREHMIAQMREDCFAQHFVVGNCAIVVASSVCLGHGNNSGPSKHTISSARKFLLILKIKIAEVLFSTLFKYGNI